MKQKTLFIVLLIISIAIFSTSSFATDNMMDDTANGIKNAVDGTSNTIENVADGIGNTMQGIAGGINNSVENIKSNGMQNDVNNYSATRTATTINTANDTFLGMNATAWGWFIMAALGLAIVGIVWFYGKQHEDGYNPNHDDNY